MTPNNTRPPKAHLTPGPGSGTLCKCPHCGGLDVSYLGRGLDICATCHGQFVCGQEPIR